MISGWESLAEYRWLRSDEAEDTRRGLLLGVDRQIGERLRLGIGYNFTEFDDDLTGLDGDGHGWFFNVVGMH